MSVNERFNNTLPVGPLKLAVLDSAKELGDKVGVGSRAVSKWECGLFETINHHLFEFSTRFTTSGSFLSAIFFGFFNCLFRHLQYHRRFLYNYYIRLHFLV